METTLENNIEDEDLHYSEDRDARVKETAEVFTPDALVQEMLDSLDVDWDNPPQDKDDNKSRVIQYLELIDQTRA